MNEPEYKNKDLREKEKLESHLKPSAFLSSDDTIAQTVSQILTGMKEHTKVCIEPLPKFKDTDVHIYGEEIFAVYKDGMALRKSEPFPNGNGVTFHYFLHRNGESTRYHLNEVSVEKKPIPV